MKLNKLAAIAGVIAYCLLPLRNVATLNRIGMR